MIAYKYNIKVRLSSMLEDRVQVIGRIITEVNCSRPTFYRWWNIQIDSDESIPGDAMRKIARILGITMDDLYNANIMEPCQTKN